MTTGDTLIDGLIQLAIAALGVLLGLLLLRRGYRMIELFSAVATFELALFAVSLLNNWFQLFDNWWLTAGIAVGAALAGAMLARTRLRVAYVIIGFATAGSICIWITRIVLSKLPEDTGLTFWTLLTILVIFLVSILLGVIFTLRYDEVALILLSAAVGVLLISESLRLDHQSEWEAALAIALGLGSIVIQYHDFLLDRRTVLAKEMESTTGTSIL